MVSTTRSAKLTGFLSNIAAGNSVDNYAQLYAHVFQH